MVKAIRKYIEITIIQKINYVQYAVNTWGIQNK